MKENINEVSNGKLTNLTKISTGGGNHQLNPEAAAAYEKMVQAAKAENVAWGITDSYRNYEQQVDVAKRKGLYSQGGLAAEPGTSNHGWGAAVDLDFKNGTSGNPFEWLKNNASKFGFTNIPREDWHWEHKQSAKNLGADVSTSTGTSTSTTDTSTTDTKSGGITWDTLLSPLKKGLNAMGINEEVNRFRRLSNVLTESIRYDEFTKPVSYTEITSLSKQNAVLRVESNSKVVSPYNAEVIEKKQDSVVLSITQKYEEFNLTIKNLTNIKVSEGSTLRRGETIGNTAGKKIVIEVDGGDLRRWFKKEEKQNTSTKDDSTIKNIYDKGDIPPIKNIYKKNDDTSIKNIYDKGDTPEIKNIYSKNINEEVKKIKRLMK